MITFIKLIKLCVVKLVAKLVLPAAKGDLEKKSLKKFLVYGNMGIGNMVMFTPFLRALRQHFPTAQIVLLVGRSGCEAVVDESGLFDKIVKLDGRLFSGLRTIFALRKNKFSLLISSFHGSSLYYVTMLMNIPRRIGHVSGPDWSNKYDFLYNIPVQMQEDEHEIDRGLRLGLPLGIRAANRTPRFYLKQKDDRFVREFFKANSLQRNKPIIAVQADTWRAQQWKRWSPRKLAQVCDRAVEQLGAKIIIFGAPGHREELQEFLALMQHEPVIALGKTTLKQSAALLQKCTLAVCNDSGLMHISAALGVPTIGIYGPTDFHRTSHVEYGPHNIMVRKDVPCAPCFRMNGDHHVMNCVDRECLNEISSDDVMAAIEEILTAISLSKSEKNSAKTENAIVENL